MRSTCWQWRDSRAERGSVFRWWLISHFALWWFLPCSSLSWQKAFSIFFARLSILFQNHPYRCKNDKRSWLWKQLKSIKDRRLDNREMKTDIIGLYTTNARKLKTLSFWELLHYGSDIFSFSDKSVRVLKAIQILASLQNLELNAIFISEAKH